MAARTFRRAAVILGIVCAVLLGSACSVVVPGRAAPGAEAHLSTFRASERPAAPREPTDEIAETTVAALQEFWRAEFPAAFGRDWVDIDAFVPVPTDDPDAPVPPCVNRVGDLVDQAFYCPSADAVAWDSDGLIPLLAERFGPAGVVVVLAHEVGHAVQTRLGVDRAQQRDPQAYPTILLETMSDCYAGVALAHFVEQPVAGLSLGPVERDDAMRALVGFRDPVGVEAGNSDAHGNAFDRVSAFQDGYRAAADRPGAGAATCADMTLDNRTFTQRRFESEADEERGGNLPVQDLLEFVESDARSWFAGLAPGWQPPPLSDGGACGPEELSVQGPAAYCPADGAVAVDVDGFETLHDEVGDYAGATLVAARYGVAAVAALGGSSVGPAAGTAASCLAGAYTGRLFDATDGFQLSPGDLDEAVQVLLMADWAARDSDGATDPAEHGFERVAHFRTGLLEGPAPCLS